MNKDKVLKKGLLFTLPNPFLDPNSPKLTPAEFIISEIDYERKSITLVLKPQTQSGEIGSTQNT